MSEFYELGATGDRSARRMDESSLPVVRAEVLGSCWPQFARCCKETRSWPPLLSGGTKGICDCRQEGSSVPLLSSSLHGTDVS